MISYTAGVNFSPLRCVTAAHQGVLTNTPRCANKHTFSQNTPKGVLFSGQAKNTP